MKTIYVLLCLVAVNAFAADRCTFSFERANPPFTANYVSVLSPFVAWGGLVRTDDGGKTWMLARPQCPEFELEFADVVSEDKTAFEYDETVFASPQRGWLRAAGSTWQTEDGGKNWFRMGGGELTSYALKGPAGWMGRQEAISDATYVTKSYTTNDAGKTWAACPSTVQSGDWQPVGKGVFLTQREARATMERSINERLSQYAIGESGDGGCTWSPKSIFPLSDRLGDVFFLDHLHGWVTAYGGIVFHTEDGGATWQQFDCPGNSRVCGNVFFKTTTIGYMSARPPDPDRNSTGIMSTIDGQEWKDLAPGDIDSLPPEWTYGRFVSLLMGKPGKATLPRLRWIARGGIVNLGGSGTF